MKYGLYINPFNEREFDTDKLSVVDVLVKDKNGTTYQVEIQRCSPGFLRNRILHNYCGLYHKQISKGKDFDLLRPVVCIWLLTENLIDNSPYFHHFIEAYDQAKGLLFTDHMAIHVLELNKWVEPADLNGLDIWPYFLKEGKHWKRLPNKLNLPVMRHAMNVLEQISDKEENYYRYRAREDAERNLLTITNQNKRMSDELKQAQQRLQVIEATVEAAKTKAKEAETKAAIEARKNALLQEKLREAGIDPDL